MPGICSRTIATTAAAVIACAGTARATDYSHPILKDIGEGAHPTFSASGDAIIFNSPRATALGEAGPRTGAFRIYTAPFDTKTGNGSSEGPKVRCLTCDQQRPAGTERSFDATPQASPDGRKILYVSSRDHEPAPLSAPGGGIGQDLYVMNSDGSDPVRLTVTPSYAGSYHPQWSPDGRRIFWSRNYADLKTWELLVADYVDKPRPHLENEVRLTSPNDTTWYEPHGFSPDQSRVIYSGTQRNALNSDIYTMELRYGPGGSVLGGGRIKRLTENPTHDEHAHYNPTGDRIAFITTRDHPGAIVGQAQGLTYDTNVPPTFDTYLVAPGIVILIGSAAVGGRTDIYLMDPDGSHPLKVTDNQAVGDLDWSPDGCHIVFRNRGNRVGLVSFPACIAAARRAGCLNPVGAVRGKRLGDARLGRKRKAQRRVLKGKLLSTRGGMDRYCVAGGGAMRIGYPTRRLRRGRGRALIALTTSPRFSIRGLRVGSSARSLRGKRHYRIGRNVWYLLPGRSARAVFKTRRGRVLEVGIADRRLSRGRRAARSLLHAWHL